MFPGMEKNVQTQCIASPIFPPTLETTFIVRCEKRQMVKTIAKIRLSP